MISALHQQKERNYLGKLSAEIRSGRPDPDVIQFLRRKAWEARQEEYATLVAWRQARSEAAKSQQVQDREIGRSPGNQASQAGDEAHAGHVPPDDAAEAPAAEETDFDPAGEPSENDYLGEDGLGKASPREDLFGIIDLVFYRTTGWEASKLADQFISRDIFKDSMPAHRGPNTFNQQGDAMPVRVIYRRAIHSPDIAYNDCYRKQRESVQEAYEKMRLRLPDGRTWKIINHNHFVWFPYNKLTHETTLLLDQTFEDIQQG